MILSPFFADVLFNPDVKNNKFNKKEKPDENDDECEEKNEEELLEGDNDLSDESNLINEKYEIKRI